MNKNKEELKEVQPIEDISEQKLNLLKECEIINNERGNKNDEY